MAPRTIMYDTRRFGLALLVGGFLLAALGRAQDCPHREYAWTRTVGGEEGDYLLGGVSVDIHENVLLAGEFGGKTDFDPGLGKDNFRSKGSGDAFVSWYTADGNYLGTYTFGVTRGAQYPYSWALSVTKRPHGGFVLGGVYNGRVDFDPTEGKDVRRPEAYNDAYLVTFKDDFSYDWTWTPRGSSYELIRTAAVDNAGGIVVAGYFDGLIHAGEGDNRREFTSNGHTDIFVAKLSASGELLWITAFGGPLRDLAYEVAVLTTGDIVLAGGFRGTVDFDPDGSHTIRTSQGDEDIFLLKLTADGGFDWVRTTGGAFVDNPLGIAVDARNEIFIGGAFSGTVDFNPSQGGDVHTSEPADYHAFVTRLASDGSYGWTRTFGGVSDTYVMSLVRSEARLILTGGYLGTVDLDPSEQVDERPAFGERSNFVCYWTPEGDYRLGDVFGGDGFDRTLGIASDSMGNVYVGGDYDAPIVDFDPTAGVSEATNHGGVDVFISKFYCGQCEAVDRHDVDWDGRRLRSTVLTLAPMGRLTVVLMSDEGEWRKSRTIDSSGFVRLGFKGLSPGIYRCSISELRDAEGRTVCQGDVAVREMTIP